MEISNATTSMTVSEILEKVQVSPLTKSKNLHGQLIVENVDNALKVYGGTRFEMIHTATKRVRELHRGALPMIPTKSKALVTALLEIEAGKVTRDY
jgi:DNA-directed RNA polymerase omega subunit